MSSPFSNSTLPPTQPYNIDPPRKSGMGRGCFVFGCLGSLLVCGLLCAGTVWYVQKNFDIWIAGFAREVAVEMIKDSEIPEQEKTEVIAQVDRVITAYKDRKINMKDLERIMEGLQDSPVFGLMMTYGLDQRYIDPSGLPEEEKKEARRTISRAMRGVLDKKIKQDDFQSAMPEFVYDESLAMDETAADADADPAKPAEEKTADEKPADEKPADDKPADATAEEIPEGAEISDKDVREFVAKLKKLADDAQIPDEDFAIDIGDEIKRAVDEALKGTSVQ